MLDKEQKLVANKVMERSFGMKSLTIYVKGTVTQMQKKNLVFPVTVSITVLEITA